MVRVPFFSVIMPTYNRAHLIGKTIASALQQEFTDFELLVVDDGSKDNTEEVVKAFGDPRVTYLKKENAERGAARNYGAARAMGTYINFFDSDDLMYPNHLAAAKKLIDTLKNPEWFHLGYDFKLPDGSLVSKVDNFTDDTKNVVLFDNKLSCNGVFVQKDIAIAFPFEEDRVLASSEDWELWIRLLARYPLHYSNEITSSVVNHDQRSIMTIPAEKVEARDLIFIEKLRQDPVVMKHYGGSFRRFVVERYTFFMLSFSGQKKRIKVWKWGMRAFAVQPLILGNKRFLASLKNSILK